jgi:hypothetical protein
MRENSTRRLRSPSTRKKEPLDSSPFAKKMPFGPGRGTTGQKETQKGIIEDLSLLWSIQVSRCTVNITCYPSNTIDSCKKHSSHQGLYSGDIP